MKQQIFLLILTVCVLSCGRQTKIALEVKKAVLPKNRFLVGS